MLQKNIILHLANYNKINIMLTRFMAATGLQINGDCCKNGLLDSILVEDMSGLGIAKSRTGPECPPRLESQGSLLKNRAICRRKVELRGPRSCCTAVNNNK